MPMRMQNASEQYCMSHSTTHATPDTKEEHTDHTARAAPLARSTRSSTHHGAQRTVRTCREGFRPFARVVASRSLSVASNVERLPRVYVALLGTSWQRRRSQCAWIEDHSAMLVRLCCLRGTARALITHAEYQLTSTRLLTRLACPSQPASDGRGRARGVRDAHTRRSDTHRLVAVLRS